MAHLDDVRFDDRSDVLQAETGRFLLPSRSRLSAYRQPYETVSGWSRIGIAVATVASLKSRQPIRAGERVTTRCYSPKVELHWAPSATEAEEWAIVSPRVGALDWLGIDPLAARLSKGVKGASIPALYNWQRAATPEWVWCESQAEKTEAMWLDFEGEYTKLWPQPFVICFPPDVKGVTAHTPDFLATRGDGRLCLFDVRPEELIDDRARRQFELTAEVCDTLGWAYQVLTGRDRVATRNLEWLKASRHARYRPPVDATGRILAVARGGATRAALLMAGDSDCPERANHWVDHLAWHRQLDFDLRRRLGSDTMFTAGISEEC